MHPLQWLIDNFSSILAAAGLLGGIVSGFVLWQLTKLLQPLRDEIAAVRNQATLKQATDTVSATASAQQDDELRKRVDHLYAIWPNCEQHRTEVDGKLVALGLSLENKITEASAKEARLNLAFREELVRAQAADTKEMSREQLTPDGVENTVRRLLDEFRKGDIQQLHDRISEMKR